MSHVVGLDVGTKTITGAVFEGTPKSFQLVDFFVEDIPELSAVDESLTDDEEEGDEEAAPTLGRLLKRIISERGLQGADFVACLDSKDVIVRDLKLDFTREDQIEKVIHFEAENHLITFDIDEMVLDYLKVSEDGGRSDVVVFAVPNETVSARLDDLKSGGADPVMLDLDSTALFNAFSTTLNYSKDKTTLLIDVGSNTTNVCLVQDGEFKKARSLRLGAYLGAYNKLQISGPETTDGIDGDRGSGFALSDVSSIESRFVEIESALRRLEPESLGALPHTNDSSADTGADLQGDDPIAILTDEEYDRVSDAAGSSTLGLGGAGTLPEESEAVEEEVPQYDYHDFLERLAMEIQRTFATNLLRTPLDLICLTGGMVQRKEAQRFFAEEFDVETIGLDFEDAFPMDVESDVRDSLNRLGGVAVGLALREFGQEECRLDFRQEQFRYERHFEKLKRPLMTMGVCLCALLFSLVFNFIADYKYWGKLRRDIRDREVKYYAAFFGGPPKGNPPWLAVAAQKELREWNEILGERSGNLPRNLDDVQAMKEIGEVLKVARQQRKLQFDVSLLDLKLQARAKTKKPKKGVPKYQVEGKSRLVLSAEERGLGSEFKRLFETHSKMWNVSPDENASPNGKIRVDLTLEVKKDHLLALE